tara:strand:+ start:1919 stop:2461 length:543 start_codon:yes stop_codon:yes gene_type:complete
MTTVTTHPNINIREKLNELDYRYVPYEKMPAGSVIQVANATGDNGIVYNTGTTPSLLGSTQDTPYTGSIFPKFSNSKIFVNISFSVLLRDEGNAAAIGLHLYRNGTLLSSTLATNPHEFFNSTGALVGSRGTYTYLDEPNSTEEVTYLLKVHFRAGYTNQIIEFDSRDSVWTVTMMEIAQ